MSHGDQLWQEAGGILPVLTGEGVQTAHHSPEILRKLMLQSAFSLPLV